MALSREQIIERIGESSRRLPLDKLVEVLDFVGYLAQRQSAAEPEWGTAEAILPAVEQFHFEPGEINALLSEIEARRAADQADDDRLSA